MFYNDGNGHGLVCATMEVGFVQWYDKSFITTGATGTALGTGKSNTALIVNAQGAGNYAAKLCDDFSYDGYTDWWMPSIDELNRMTALYTICGLSGYAYWSSSEISQGLAWYEHLSSGVQFDDDKDQNHMVRPVRAF